MQKCPKCGYEGSVNAPVCSNCGLSLAVEASTPETNERSAPQNADSSTTTIRIAGQEASRVGAAFWVLLSLFWIWFSEAPGAWALLLAPTLLGALWPLIRNPGMTSKLDLLEEKLQSKHQQAGAKTGKFAQYFTKPLFVGCLLIWRKTQPLADVHLRAGLRVAAIAYFAGVMVTLLLVVGYVIVVVVVVIAVLLFLLWLLGEALSRSTGSGQAAPAKHSTRSVNVDEYRSGYEEGKKAGPISQLGDAFFSVLDMGRPDYIRGYKDGHQDRTFDPYRKDE